MHVVRIAGSRMIEAGIDGLSRGNRLGATMRGFNPLQFPPLTNEQSKYELSWSHGFRLWWVGILDHMISKDCFKYKRYNLLWEPPPAPAETAL